MVSEPAQNDSSSEPLKAMANAPDSTQVPLPEDENDFDLFGPADAAGATRTSQSQQPVPPGPAQQPVGAPAVQQVTVGLDDRCRHTPRASTVGRTSHCSPTRAKRVDNSCLSSFLVLSTLFLSVHTLVQHFQHSLLTLHHLQHHLLHSRVSAPSTSGVGSNRAEKYLPSLPLIEHGNMNKGRVKELEEYHRWLEVLASWLALIDDNYVGELRQALVHDTDIKQSVLAAPVASRSAKLFYYLQQSLQKFDRGMELVRSTSMRQGQAACGYECMRQLHNTFSVVARMEAIAVRDEALKLSGKASGYKRPLDAVRFLGYRAASTNLYFPQKIFESS